MLIIEARTPYEAWYQLNQAFLTETQQMGMAGGRACLTNVLLRIGWYDISDLDLGKIGYTKTKWNHLKKKYYSQQQFDNLVTRCKHYLEKNKDTVPIGMHFLGEKAREDGLNFHSSLDPQGGPCLMSMSFLKFKSGSPQIAVFSRSSEVVSRLYADLIFLGRILKKLCDNLGQGYDPRSCQVTWMFQSTYQNTYQAPIFWEKFSKEPLLQFPDCPWKEKILTTYKRITDGALSSYAVERRVQQFIRGDRVTIPVNNEELLL